MRIAPPDFDFLFLPGRGNSGPDHWMTHWLGLFPNASRVLQRTWDAPDPEDWVQRVDQAVRAAPKDVVLLGHSMATITTVKWAGRAEPDVLAKVKGAFLVATTDVEDPDPDFDLVRPFAPIPLAPLPFPTLVVASRNDPRVSFERSRQFATAWGAAFVDVGELGHMGNPDKLRDWPVGLLMLGKLLGMAGL